MDITSIHNWYERAVFNEVMAQSQAFPHLQGNDDVLADVACVALNRLQPRYIRHEVDFDLQLSHGLREHEARQPVAVRVLLVIHEVASGADLQRVRDDARAAVGRRSQADDLRSQDDGPVVAIVRQVIDAGVDGHVFAYSTERLWLGARRAPPPESSLNLRR